MSMTFKALAAVAILAGAVCFAPQHAAAEDKAPPATATRPSQSGPDQTSVPNNAAPPASRTQTTGQTPPDPTIKEMNERERSKVEREGK